MAVLIVDDHDFVRRGVAMVLEEAGFASVAVADVPRMSDGEIVEMAAAAAPVLVLLDLHLGEARLGTALVRPLVDVGATVVAVTASNDQRLWRECLEAGAVGVLEKGAPFEETVAALQRAAAGEPVMNASTLEATLEAGAAAAAEQRRLDALWQSLTDREREVLRELVRGRRPQEIAAASGRSFRTVHHQVQAIRSKLQVQTQAAAVALAVSCRWFED